VFRSEWTFVDRERQHCPVCQDRPLAWWTAPPRVHTDREVVRRAVCSCGARFQVSAEPREP